MNKFFEKQWWHLLGALALLLIASEAASAPNVITGSLWGVSSSQWYWAAIYFAIGHQLFVMLAWRSQLHFQWLSKRFGKNGFVYYSRGFALLSFARLFSLIALSIANHNTLIGSRVLFNAIAILFILLVTWLMVSVLRYFSLERALGADHFDERFRKMGLVKGGIFKYIRNGMYIVGLLTLWLPGLLLASKGGLLIGLLSPAYIWVHYFATEKPDLAHIYGSSVA